MPKPISVAGNDAVVAQGVAHPVVRAQSRWRAPGPRPPAAARPGVARGSRLPRAKLHHAAGHIGDVAPEIDQYRQQRADMGGDIQGQPLIRPAEELRHQDEVAGGGDGQEFGDALHHRQNQDVDIGHAQSPPHGPRRRRCGGPCRFLRESAESVCWLIARGPIPRRLDN